MSTKSPGDLDQAVDLGDREPAVEHVGEPLLAWLGAPVREREEAHGVGRCGYSVRSVPTVTTTFAAEPAMACVPGSSGSRLATFNSEPTCRAAGW